MGQPINHLKRDKLTATQSGEFPAPARRGILHRIQNPAGFPATEHTRVDRACYWRSVARGPLGVLLTRKVTVLTALPSTAALKSMCCHTGLGPLGATKMAWMG